MKKLLLALTLITLFAGDATLPGQSKVQPKPSRERD
jgi:hypothetical protein